MAIENLQSAETQVAWRRLHQRSDHASMHLHPDVVASAVGEGLVHCQWEDRSTLTALGVLAPKSIRVFKMKGIGRIGTLEGYRVVADRLLGDCSERASRTFIHECATLLESGRADCVLFEDLDVDSELWRGVHSVAAEAGLCITTPNGVQPHWWIRFPDPPEDYWKEFSGKTRNTFRRKCKKLPHTVMRVEREEQVDEFLEASHSISVNTWQTRRLGLRVRNDEDEREFYFRMARMGALRCYLLRGDDGRPVAFMVGMQHGSVFVYEEVGYDTAYAKKSPGTVLLYRVLTDLHEYRPVRLLDFGTGHADYKQMFGNHQTESGPLLVVADRLRPKALVELEQARRAIEQHARILVRRSGLYERIRRRYRA